jgi:hypothetical protein
MHYSKTLHGTAVVSDCSSFIGPDCTAVCSDCTVICAVCTALGSDVQLLVLVVQL